MASSASPDSPSSVSAASDASASRKPRRSRLPLLVVARFIGGARSRPPGRRRAARPGRRTRPPAGATRRPARRGPPSTSRSSASWSMPSASWEPRSESAHGCRTRASTSGCSWTPHAVGVNRTAWISPRGVRASTVAAGGSPVTTSLFHCTPRRGVASDPSSGSASAARSQPTSSRPSCWPRGLTPTVPPSATAMSWWPRQMPSVGIASATAERTRSFTGLSQSCFASSSAPMGPPRTRKASYSSTAGSSSPA